MDDFIRDDLGVLPDFGRKLSKSPQPFLTFLKAQSPILSIVSNQMFLTCFEIFHGQLIQQMPVLQKPIVLTVLNIVNFLTHISHEYKKQNEPQIFL